MKEQYTPEPWNFHPPHSGYPGDCCCLIGQKSRILAHIPKEGNPKERAEFFANGRRIVACVNACAGLMTETLASLPEGMLWKLLREVAVLSPDLDLASLADRLAPPKAEKGGAA